MDFRMWGRVFLLLSLPFFAACTPNDPFEPEVVADPEEITLISASGIVFEPGIDRLSITVAYSRGWMATLNDDSWCSIDKISGNGNDVITVSLKDRTDPATRSTVLTVVSFADPELKSSITIGKSEVAFEISHEKIDFNETLAESGVTITHPGNWTASLSDDSWCRIDRTEGSGDAQIKITITPRARVGNSVSVLTITSVDYPSLNAEIPLTPPTPSAHGRLTVLNKATKGNGIDIVILGDGFTDDDFKAGGKWETTLEKSLTAIFLLEPFRSFREYFNLYAVSAVSATDRIGSGTPGDTFFETYYSGDRFIRSADLQKTFAFASEYTPAGERYGAMENLIVALIVNDSRYGGTAYFDENSGIGISTLHSLYFDYELIHETLGHAFGKLADEYIEFDGAIPPATANTNGKRKTSLGYYQNVEYTDLPEAFGNSAWRSLYRSGYPGVGIFEGGHTYEFGVWRSSQASIMNSRNTGYFNAVSREILVRLIYRLAGMENLYSLDVFRQYDQINTGPHTRQAAPPINLPPAWYPPI